MTNASNSPGNVDVLIAGAGPVGLFLATECARRGLRFRIVEAQPTQSQHSKALAIFPRTLEIFDMAGVSAPFLEAANRVTTVKLIAHAHTLGQIAFHPDDTPYPFVAMVPQDVTEKLLVEALVGRGGAVEYETQLVSAVQDDAGVTATLECRGTRSDVRASFLVGCDGAHSAVRHLLNLTFEGGEYPDSFMLADVHTNDALPADELQLCPNEAGPLAIFPMNVTRRRIVATVDAPDGDAPSLEFVRQMLAQRAPAGIEAQSLVWATYFRIHHRHVGTLQERRIFIAGDAAHIHSPFGGQGMNTGLHDAWKLVWKLDFAVRGRAKRELLESYTQERIPVIKGVIEVTDMMTRALSARNPVVRAVRDTVIPIATHLPAFQHAFVTRLSGLGIGYEGSPIVAGGGQRYFDDSLRGGQAICSRFLLLLDPGTEPAVRAQADALAVAHSGAVEVRSHAGPGMLLLRPDGYVAYEAPARDADALTGAAALLAHQLRS